MSYSTRDDDHDRPCCLESSPKLDLQLLFSDLLIRGGRAGHEYSIVEVLGVMELGVEDGRPAVGRLMAAVWHERRPKILKWA